jgi:hypothetical protein
MFGLLVANWGVVRQIFPFYLQAATLLYRDGLEYPYLILPQQHFAPMLTYGLHFVLIFLVRFVETKPTHHSEVFFLIHVIYIFTYHYV